MDAATRKTALRLIPYGLYVITTKAGDSVSGATVNWVSQMSFEPPLLALGVKKDTESFANIKAGGDLAISFLGTGQGALAFAFFGDTPFEGSEFVAEAPQALTLKELNLNYGGSRSATGAGCLPPGISVSR